MNEKQAIDLLKLHKRRAMKDCAFVEEFDLAISALEKQIAMKPMKSTYDLFLSSGWEYQCPACSLAVGTNKYSFDYTGEDAFCPSCGKKLDWSDVEND